MTVAHEIQVSAAVVRGLASSFSRCERRDHSTEIDVALAHAQHAAYVQVLRRWVGQVMSVPVNHGHPDCVFVEDTVVVVDGHAAVVARPGAASRRGEETAVARALQVLCPEMALYTMTPPACLDGGDVLRIRDALFVGMSSRTNEAGVAFLQDVAESFGVRVVKVAVNSVLHLKSVCSLAAPDLLLYDAAAEIAPTVFLDTIDGLRCEPALEARGANVLALEGGRVIVSAAAPRTAQMLEELGLGVDTIDISELHKADGALTCPSVRIPEAGGWCT